MLSASPVLRHHRWPAAPVCPHDHAAAPSIEPDTTHRDKVRDRVSRFGDDVWLAVVEKDPHDMCPGHSRYAAVTEIQTQKIDVDGMLVLVEGFEPPLGRF
jgi:hypothetical protein